MMSQNSRPTSAGAFDPISEHISPIPHRISPNRPDVAGELSALREEIRQLREALNPPKSMLIIGADVERILSAIPMSATDQEETLVGMSKELKRLDADNERLQQQVEFLLEQIRKLKNDA